MRVKKHITIIEERDIEIIGATLLSVDEARKLLTKDERKYNANWWLRSPAKYSYCVSYIGKNGNVYCCGGRVDSPHLIRPALRIKLNCSFNIGDIFEFDGRKFKIISPDLAWMIDSDLGCFQFNSDWHDPSAHVYELSQAKVVVDEWLDMARRRN